VVIPISDVTAIILAGGQSYRYRKQAKINKSWETIDDIPLIVKSILTASSLTHQIIISVANSRQQTNIKKKLNLEFLNGSNLNISYAIDNPEIIPRGPLRGILTAIDNVTTKYAVIQPVDMPLVKAEDLERLISGIVQSSSNMASYSVLNQWVTTLLFAIDISISRSVLNQLKSINASRISALFRAIPTTVLFNCNSQSSQFYNVNTPQDLETLEQCSRITSFSHSLFNGSPEFFTIQHWINTPPDQIEEVIESFRQEFEMINITKFQFDMLKDLQRIIGKSQYDELGFLKQESKIKGLLGLNK
jgi:molybdopterin-guanine dinucleotide biosynthesis protein A